MAENDDLSERELEILRLVATGASNKEIAQKLFISTNTVKVHLRNVFAKIGVASRTEAAMYAVNVGLVLAASPSESLSDSELDTQELDRTGDQISTLLRSEQYEQMLSRRRVWVGVSLSLILLLVIVFFLRYTGMISSAGSNSADGQPAAISMPHWDKKKPMSVARYGMASAVYANQIYLVGGENEQAVVNLNERYDPTNDHWETLASKPQAVSDVQAAVIGGKIYIPGGRLNTGAPTDILEVYDPRKNQWEQGTSMPVALSAYAMQSFEGKLYLFGGWDGKNYLASVYEYDPSQDQWRERAPMPTARGYAGTAVVSNKIYVFGGYDGENALSVNEVFEPDLADEQARVWQSEAPLPESKYAMGVTSLADTIYIVGGIGNSKEKSVSLVFNPQNDEWRTLEASIDEIGSKLSLVSLESYIYALGGVIDGAASNEVLAEKVIYTISIPLITK